MVSVREMKRLNSPPPVYDPEGIHLTVSLQHGGECRTKPIPHYVGGSVVKLDYVIARQLSLNALKNSAITYFGEPLGMRMYYICMNNSFRAMNTDEDVKVWAVKYIPLREMVVYCEDVEDMGNCVIGEDLGNIDKGKGELVVDSSMSNSKGRLVQGQRGKGDRHLIDEDELEGENDLGREGDGDRQVEMGDSDLDDFSDSDYAIDEESEDDDVLFEKNVNDNRDDEEHSESSKSSEDNDDVLCLDGDFNENKDSDGEQNEPNYPVFNSDVIFEPEFELGMIFGSRDEFKKAVHSYAIKTKRSIKFTKIAPTRVYAKCDEGDCGWKAHLIKVNGEESFQIRQYVGRHTCTPTFKVKNVKSTWISEKFLRKFVADPKRRVGGFRQDVIDELGCDVTKEQAYRARRLALKKLEGNPSEQYNKLWDYAEELKRSNPGSTVVVGSKQDDDGFERLETFYVCLDAVKKGFKAGCRRIIGVDGCHLKGPHNGILLTAVGVDGNNSLYPLAWAVLNPTYLDSFGKF